MLQKKFEHKCTPLHMYNLCHSMLGHFHHYHQAYLLNKDEKLITVKVAIKIKSLEFGRWSIGEGQ